MTASDRTKQRLADTLKAMTVSVPLSRIRVGELCTLCRLDRRTFYYHFRDVYDLTAWIFDQTVDDCIPLLKDGPGERGLLVALRRIWADEVFYSRALAEDSQNALGRYFLKHSVDLLTDALQKVPGHEKLSEEERFAIGYHCFGALGMIRRWLFYDRQRSPEEMSELLMGCTPQLLRCIFQPDEGKGEAT